MGIFRIVLALSVFAAHAYDAFGANVPLNDWVSLAARGSLHIYVWSGHAVFAFFILSGFYMAMVINRKYSKVPDGTRRFYFNRALRLYPTNWVIIAIYALLFVLSATPSFLTLNLTHGAAWLTPIAFFCNFFFAGAEIITLSDYGNWQYVIGPIWSLSLESYFYVLAPFIVTRPIKFIALLAVGSAVLRLSLYQFGFAPTPWRYFFFPSDLVFFLMGVFSYRLFDPFKSAGWVKFAGMASAAALLSVVLCEKFWTYCGELDNWESWAFYTCVAICTPFIFHLTRNSVIDNFIGQLSYPVYLGHMLVFAAIARFYHGHIERGLLALILTTLFATSIYFVVDKPVENIRRRISDRLPVGYPGRSSFATGVSLGGNVKVS